MTNYKALTISQPYASLIAAGEKMVENRTWETLYRGRLLIHAGKGRQYLSAKELKKYPTACIVAVAEVIECVYVPALAERIRRGIKYRGLGLTAMQIIAAHEHTEGPFGWVLMGVRRLERPVPCSGAQGLWTPTPDVVALVTEQIDVTPPVLH